MKYSNFTSFAIILSSCVMSAYANCTGNSRGANCGCDSDSQCSSGRCGPRNRCVGDRRALRYSEKEIDHLALWEEQKNNCLTTSYSLAVLVEGHISLLAMPHEDGCHPLWFHDPSNSDHQTGKEVLVGSPNSVDRDTFDASWENSMYLDTYKLENLVKAFDAADSLHGKEYNVIDSNCATFAISMTSELGYQVGPEVTNFVASKLAKSAIPDHVRASSSLAKLGQNIDLSDSFGLMNRLVKQYLTNEAN